MKSAVPELIILFIIFIFPNYSLADMINLTGAQLSPNVAEYYIDDDKLLLKLEIGESDKEFFEDLIKGDEQIKKKFLREKLFIKDDRGNKLNGIVKLVEDRKRTIRPSPINNPPGGILPSKNVTYLQIEYPFIKRPNSLVFNPPLRKNGKVAVSYGFIVYHDNIPIIDFRFLPYNQKLILDWEDPWYSKFENKNLKRHHSSSFMSFLYVEPYEVRLEMLVRLKELEEWVNLDIGSREYLSFVEQERIKEKITEFIVTRNKLKIDGIPQNPIVDSIQFVKVNLLGIQYYDKPEIIDTVSAVIGIILVYLTEGIPDKITVDWDMFSNIANKIPATITDPSGPFPDFLTPDYNTLVWENYLKNYEIPQVSSVIVKKTFFTRIHILLIALLVPACIIFLLINYKHKKQWNKHFFIYYIIFVVIIFILLNSLVPKYEFYQTDKHESIVSLLLKNIYRSFDFKNESDIYDKLSTSIEGELLREIYLEIKKNLEYENTGGAKAKIESIKLEKVSPRQMGFGNQYEYNTEWTVTGRVEHWGHIHNRTNKYNALITVKNVENVWKITEFQLIDEQRVMPK